MTGERPRGPSTRTSGVMRSLGLGPCVRLPLEVDAASIAAEIGALPESAWNGSTRNPAVQSQVDAFFAYGSRRGPAARVHGPRPVFDRLLTLRKFLQDGMPGALLRTLVARLPGGAFVPLHTDSVEHYRDTVRAVIPVTTNPKARLFSDGQWYQVPVGEVWAFDNLSRHAAVNDGTAPRTHVLCDFVPDDRLLDLLRAGRPAVGAVDDLASARIAEMSQQRYAENRWRHLGFRILERLHLR